MNFGAVYFELLTVKENYPVLFIRFDNFFNFLHIVGLGGNIW